MTGQEIPYKIYEFYRNNPEETDREATVKKWNVGSVSAEDLYKQGVRAAMDFLTDNYGCTATTDAEFDAFIQGRGTFGHTDNQKLEAINTQAWILHFTNPVECWANVRRSGYPKS